MGYLIGQFIFCLFCAALIGAVVGWLLRSLVDDDCGHEAELDELRAEVERIGSERDAARADADAAQSEPAAVAPVPVVAAADEPPPAPEVAESAPLVELPDDLDELTDEQRAQAKAAVTDRFAASAVDAGAADDLKRIKGVGPVLEGVLNDMNINTFLQVAELTPDEVRAVSAAIETFPDRIERDEWLPQARRLHDEKG